MTRDGSGDANRPDSLGESAAAQLRLRDIQRRAGRGDLPGAARLAEAALANGADHPLILSVVAAQREAEGRLDEAFELLMRAHAGAPRALGILNALGLNLTRIGQFDEAVAYFTRALAIDPSFANALANRGIALIALAKLTMGRRDLEAAVGIEPGNLIAINGLAALALRRGKHDEARQLAEQVLARAPGFPSAMLTLAGAETAAGLAQAGEARLRVMIADVRVGREDRFVAWGQLGDALASQARFDDAFEAWRQSNALQQAHFRRDYAGGMSTLELVRTFTRQLPGAVPPSDCSPGPNGGETGHVFLLGFPRSGTTLLEQVLESHPDVATLAERECLIDATRTWMGDPTRFAGFCTARPSELKEHRRKYWERVRQEGVDPAGRVFVDKHPFNTWRLPLIARLFPEARILFARRDPRDTVLSCFQHRFKMSAPVYQMLTLEGAAKLYAATMALAEATAAAFGQVVRPCALEAIITDFDRETQDICSYIGVKWTPRLRDFASKVAERGVFTPSGPQLVAGLNARGVGKWRNYAIQIAPVLPTLQPWVDWFGY